MASKKAKTVLVTTSYRGVFWGEEVSRPATDQIVLRGARCAIYWATSGGFLELAETGPTVASKIGTRVAGQIELLGVTSVTQCSEAARLAWEQHP